MREVESLIASFADVDIAVRQSAVSAVVSLGRLGDRCVVDQLILTLGSRDSNLRVGAVEALGEIGDNAAIMPLILTVKAEASFWDPYEVDNDYLYYKARIALGKLAPAVIEPLLTFIEDENVYLRRLVMQALEELVLCQALEQFRAALEDEDFLVRRIAVRALGKLGDKPSLVLLEKIVREDKVGDRWGITNSAVASKAIEQIKSASAG